MKTFFHVDMDAFFVSVEELFDPSLKGKPVVVGGQPDERGVVSAASYAARKFGIHSAMPLRTAYKLCPQAIFVDGHRERYLEYSEKVFVVLQQFSPRVEMASIDEAYLDLTGTERLHGPPLAAAHRLHEAMRRGTSLNCSIGASTSRLVSKVASDQAKPNGVLWIMPGGEARFLGPLDVRKIPGVGKVTERNLHACGIRKVRDLAALEEAFLEERFGKWGLALAGKARGEDAGGWFDGEVGEGDDPKSISHEHTFSVDTADTTAIDAMLVRLAEMVARRLRDHKLWTRTVQIKLRYSDFSTFTRAKTLDHATQIDTELAEAARALFHRAWSGKAIRLLGVYAQSLEADEGQTNLLEEEKTERWRKTLKAVDRLRDKYGDGTVSLAASLKAGFRARVHENPENLPGKTPKKEE
ncbi:MAG: DNA polymerase IV [Acidobacteria bacterium]|jgi:DNA polymerase-4|nr:MAG: DNA polymerase IV [Acidobacteriota bacterium]